MKFLSFPSFAPPNKTKNNYNYNSVMSLPFCYYYLYLLISMVFEFLQLTSARNNNDKRVSAIAQKRPKQNALVSVVEH